MPPETFFWLFLIVFMIVFEVFLYILLNLIESILRKVFKFPSHEEKIFAQCVLMAYYLKKNERRKAVEQVDNFVSSLSVFSKDIFNKPQNKLYRPEFSLLIKGRNEIKRMLLFSKKDIAGLLLKFGMAMVHKNDSEAYSSLSQIIKEARRYGEMKGRFQKFLVGVEKYYNLAALILSIIAIASVILQFLGLLPYKIVEPTF